MLSNFIIFGAQYLVFVIALVATVYFLLQPRTQQKELVIFALITLPLTYLLARIAGWLYYNPRPFVVGHFVPIIPHKDVNGFPSDHTLASAAMAVVIFKFNKKLGVVLGVLALVVGISRVAAGVHHVIDIVASVCIAAVVGWLVNKYIYSKIFHNSPHQKLFYEPKN